MRRFFQYFLICGLLGVAEANTALDPKPNGNEWMAQHQEMLEVGKQENINVLFLGDSITDFWRSADPQKGGKTVWDKVMAPLGAANFGIAGDRTQQVLWRIQNGELDHIQPKVVVLLIGTNNTGLEHDNITVRNTPDEALDGIEAVLQAVRAKLPQARILLLGLFPRNEPNDLHRPVIRYINERLAGLEDGETVFYLDLGPKFLLPDGTIPPEVMPDLVHPSGKGYEIWAEAIQKPLAELLQP